MTKGVPASPSGYSAEPEPSCTVSAVPVSIPNAVGLSRTRLAELLYEHEGFIDAAQNHGAPDRDVPVWIEDNLNARHSGDCTKECHPCMACHAKWALEQWDEFAAMLERAASAMSAGTAATTKIGAGLQPASAVAKPDAQGPSQ